MRYLHFFQPGFDARSKAQEVEYEACGKVTMTDDLPVVVGTAPKRRVALWPLLLLLLVAGLWLTACNGEATADREATVEALGQAVVLTATADAEEDESPRQLQATAEAAATEAVSTIVAISAEATVTAVAAATSAAAEADQQPAPPPVASPPGGAGSPAEEIGAELTLYGVDPTVGDLVWLQPDVVLAGTDLQRYIPGGPETAVSLTNFVLAADIRAESPTTACGFSLRADDLSQISDQHLLLVGLGPLRLETFQEGTMSPDGFRGVAFTEASNDPQFSLQPGATNRIAVVARDDTFAIYSNGVEVMAVDPVTQLNAGFVALATFSEENIGACHFTNSWLWALP